MGGKKVCIVVTKDNTYCKKPRYNVGSILLPLLRTARLLCSVRFLRSFFYITKNVHAPSINRKTSHDMNEFLFPLLLIVQTQMSSWIDLLNYAVQLLTELIPEVEYLLGYKCQLL